MNTKGDDGLSSAERQRLKSEKLEIKARARKAKAEKREADLADARAQYGLFGPSLYRGRRLLTRVLRRLGIKR